MFKYKLFKNAIEKNLTNFLFNYLILKKEATIYLFENNLVPYEETFGSFRDPQAPNTYSVYSDLAMETLLQKILIKLFFLHTHTQDFTKKVMN